MDDKQPDNRPSSDRSENVPQSGNPIADPAAKVAASGQTIELLEQLPPYTRSLLKIRVPVSVRLASKRQTIRQILQLGPGAIISFDKPCDKMLELCAGDCTVATGEAVKVGDKFGLRIHAMTRPEERFRKVPRRT